MPAGSWHVPSPGPRNGFLLPEEPITTLDDYLSIGGGYGLERARQRGPDATITELTRSGLRGRGGAGFPAGRKWRTVRNAPGPTKYAVCNAAEGEPATFKDRALLRTNPYEVVEGLAIAAMAVETDEVFVALKASFASEREALLRAVEEFQASGIVSDLTVGVVAGPEEYLFGEEKALLEVIEGNDPQPRWLPPYLHGLFATAPQLGWQSHEPEPGHESGEVSNPTLVSNVETLANVPHILARGADWFRSYGTSRSPGTIVCTVVGDVERPGVTEIELGTPLRALVEVTGGVAPGRTVKAVFSGITNPVLRGDRIDTPLTYEDLAAAGSGLGAAGFAVYDDTACMIEVATAFSRFLWVESCGQCPACKLGAGRITASLERIAARRAAHGDLRAIHRALRVVSDGNRCFLPVEEQQVVGSILRTFPEDVAAHLERRCPAPRSILVPKIVDITEEGVIYDDHQHLKQPDWTYAIA